MEPVSAILGVVGLGMSIFGGISGAQSSAFYANQSKQIAGAEESVQNQELDTRKQAMELSNQRSQIENARNIQRARAAAVQAGVTKGASYGSGIPGGLAQVSGQGAWNAEGLSQGLQQGETMFGLNTQLNTLNYQKAVMTADAQTAQSTAQGWSSLGGSIMKSGPMLGQMSKGFGGFSFGGASA